jgi:hypothetical protein
LIEEAELDKLMLSNLCSVGLEEVMDAHSEHEVSARTVKSHHKSKKVKKIELNSLVFQNEGHFLELRWF